MKTFTMCSILLQLCLKGILLGRLNFDQMFQEAYTVLWKHFYSTFQALTLGFVAFRRALILVSQIHSCTFAHLFWYHKSSVLPDFISRSTTYLTFIWTNIRYFITCHCCRQCNQRTKLWMQVFSPLFIPNHDQQRDLVFWHVCDRGCQATVLEVLYILQRVPAAKFHIKQWAPDLPFVSSSLICS